jgi:hypothetical protein
MVTDSDRHSPDSGLALFPAVRSALDAHRLLAEEGYRVRLVAPPPRFRSGCDLAVEVNLVEKLGIERRLASRRIACLGIEPLGEAAAALLSVVRTADFGDWLMVKSGNMKLTFDKKTGVIVNTSGGGCPDIPYLYAALVGKTLAAAPRPGERGFTLCALMLDFALEEARRLWKGRAQ